MNRVPEVFWAETVVIALEKEKIIPNEKKAKKDKIVVEL